MFGRSHEIVLPSYGRRRSHARLPRWLVLLLCGAAAGAAAVIVVQERHLPPRLSAAASAELRSAFEQADAERRGLRETLAQTQQRLTGALAQQQAMADDLAASRASASRLQEHLGLVVGALPPDPRGGTVAVRAGRFSADAGQLRYDIVLTRDSAAGRPMPGTLQLVVAGHSGAGAEASVVARPIPLSLGRHEVVRGSVPLPDGFTPSQATVRVLEPGAGKALGMRVLRVQ